MQVLAGDHFICILIAKLALLARLHWQNDTNHKHDKATVTRF